MESSGAKESARGQPPMLNVSLPAIDFLPLDLMSGCGVERPDSTTDTVEGPRTRDRIIGKRRLLLFY